ncbi:MAG: glycosyl transferase family 1, partial [Alphaproteobacteria bacterium PA3]
AVSRVLGRGMAALHDRMDGVEALVARNLEMLVIARALQRRMGGRPRLVYEILDLHRMLTAPGPAGQAMRLLQARLGRSVDLAITSSPAYVTQHLAAMPFADRIILVENKVLTEGPRPAYPPPAAPAPPFRIGWFGALRCQRSFDLLSALAARLAGRVEVILRGRPSAAVFPDFAGMVARAPHLRYAGPYTAEDLPSHYVDVHFSWCIDYYEEGHNSAWLLPNRLYESAAHLAVPIALAEVETGRFLRARDLGLVVDRTNLDSLVALFAAMTDERHSHLRRALAEAPP